MGFGVVEVYVGGEADYCRMSVSRCISGPIWDAQVVREGVRNNEVEIFKKTTCGREHQEGGIWIFIQVGETEIEIAMVCIVCHDLQSFLI